LNQNQEEHAPLVDAWIRETTNDLSSQRLVQLFGEGIQALEKRTLVTLSDVTLGAILDRVLHDSQKKYPFLSGLKIGPTGISFDESLPRIDQQEPARVIESFRSFLIEFLTILGNLTGGILTKPLHQELTTVRLSNSRDGRKDL
jgi:hypothetical protein